MKQSLLALLVVSSCVAPIDTAQPTPPLSPVSQPSSTPTTGAGLTPPPTTKPTSIPGMKTFTYEPWSIEMLLPERAVTSFDPANQYLNIGLSWKQTARLRRIDAPPPAELSQAPKEWSWGDDLKILDEGSLPNGGIFRVVTFEVRVGREGLPGQHIHWMETVSRAYAAIPLSKTHYLDCILYLEFDVSKDVETRKLAKDLFSSIKKK